MGKAHRIGTFTIATLCQVMAGCATLPPNTVPELAAQLSEDGALLDASKTAAIIGSTELQHDNPTRLAGVTLDFYGVQGGAGGVHYVRFRLSGICVRVADFERRFGKPLKPILITDGGGLSELWIIRHSGADVKIELLRMQRIEDCAKELWIYQPSPKLNGQS